MRYSFKSIFWDLFYPVLLIVSVYPIQINGYLNPHDEGIWLGTLQALFEGKRLYRDIYFHYGPILPLTLHAALHFTPFTLSSIRKIVWLLNVTGLLCVYFCLLKFVRSWYLRVAGGIFVFAVPLAAHVLTIPMAARYGSGFASILLWPLERDLSFQKQWKAVFLSGLLAAVSVGVSQEVGVAAFVAGVVFLASHRHHRDLIKTYLCGFFALAVPALITMAAYYGFMNYVQSAVFQAGRLVLVERAKFPSPQWSLIRQSAQGTLTWLAPWQNLAVTLAGLLPTVTYALYLATWWMRGRQKEKPAATALALYGLLTALSAWGRSDTWHIYFALSPALLLWAYDADGFSLLIEQKGSWAAIGFIVAGAFLTLPSYFAQQAKQKWLEESQRITHLQRAGSCQLPYPQANGYERLVDWIHAKTRPGEPILFFPYDGSIYFLADRPNPTFLPVLALGVTEPMQQRAVSEIEAAQVHWAIRDTENTFFDGVPIEKFLPVVNDYLLSHYRVTETIGPFQFLERRSSPAYWTGKPA